MNAFDFDGTLYDGDSSIDFFKFCLSRYPKTWITLPKVLFSYFLFRINKIQTDSFKEVFFSILLQVKDIDSCLETFWDKHQAKIKPQVLTKFSRGDYVISASPEFLLQWPTHKINAVLIGTVIDPASGKMLSKNCKGIEKVKRCKQIDDSIHFSSVFSDSLTDLPLLQIADSFYLVAGNLIEKLSQN